MIINNHLYIFVHIPKCAGTTFNHHVLSHIKKEEFLRAHYSRIGRSKRLPDSLLNTKDVDAYLRTLPYAEKERIRVIAGHLAYYGVHQHFSKVPKYITFLRHPVERTFSYYNFLVARWKAQGFLTDWLRTSLISKETGLRSFDEWFVRAPYMHNFMTRFLIKPAMELPQKELTAKDLLEAKKRLSQFHFIGLTEHFDHDASLIYRELGLGEVTGRRENVSFKFFTNPEASTRSLVLEKSQMDLELYAYAQDLREERLNGYAPDGNKR